MAYPPHTLVTCGGTLAEKAASDEIWQVGIRGVNNDGGPVDASQLEALAEAIATGDDLTPGLDDWFTSANSHMANPSQLRWVKAANIGPDGNYTSEPGIYEYPAPVTAGNTQAAPSFCSVSLSWTTGSSFGFAQRGRIYPPNFATAIQIGSKITAAHQADLVLSAGEFLLAVDKNASEYNFEPSVVSSHGVFRKITGVRVGDVYDTQRRRKDAVAETYLSAPYA